MKNPLGSLRQPSKVILVFFIKLWNGKCMYVNNEWNNSMCYINI